MRIFCSLFFFSFSRLELASTPGPLGPFAALRDSALRFVYGRAKEKRPRYIRMLPNFPHKYEIFIIFKDYSAAISRN